ncbi:MAG: integration host factor subunit beta [Bacteroidales bacterium]|nr:integration host factor subunit beta [Bacteroidales bacterium]
MTKAEVVNEIAQKTGIEKIAIMTVVEELMTVIKDSLTEGENVYLRGFGSFIVRKRAEKTGRNISKNTTVIIPAHNIPAFKPAKSFMADVKNNTK